MLAAPAWLTNSLFLQLVQQEKISFNSIEKTQDDLHSSFLQVQLFQ
jgi:hypothetical protein